MKRLAILIEASNPREAQEALDDVVASITAGQATGEYEDGAARIRFSWTEVDAKAPTKS